MAIDKQKGELLFNAILNDDFTIIINEIRTGLNINDRLGDEETLLHKSFRVKKIQVTEHLILSGAKLFEKNQHQRTPLHIGASNGFFEGCELYTLLVKDLNQQDHKGRIPLMMAIKFRQKPIIKLLMGKGSDTNLEDNNGFSSLMWAIKYLNPQELKEIFTDDNEEELETQIEKHIEQGSEVQVADSSIEFFNDNFKDSLSDEQEEVIMPNPLKEMLKKNEQSDDIIPYSISEHIESLKNRSEEQSAFDYNINESIKEKKEAVDADYDIGPQSSSTDKSVESFSRSVQKDQQGEENKNNEDIEGKLFRNKNNENSDNNLDDHSSEIIRVTSTSQEDEKEEDIMKVKSSADPVTRTQEQERIKVSEVRPEILNQENEIQRVKSIPQPDSSTEDEIKIKSNEDVQSLEKDDSPIIIRSKKNDGEDESLQENLKVNSKATEHETYENEIQKVKSLEQDFDEDLYKREDKEEKKLEETQDQTSSKKNESATERVASSGAEVIIDRKKDITYLKDGYSEIYKDEYGEIKSVDKNISEEKDIAEIKTVDKNLTKEEISKIKNVDKTLKSEQDIQYLEPDQMDQVEAVNLEGKINYEEVDGYKERVIDKNIESQSTIKRPERVDVDTYEEDVFNGDISRKNQDIKEESDILGVARGSGEIDDNGKGGFQFKNIPKTDETEEESKVIEDLKREIKEQQEQEEEIKALNSEEDDSDDPNLTPAENKLLQAMSDPDHKNKKGQSLCWLAAFNGQVELLKKLIHKGANYEIKDPQGVSPLMAAAMKGRTEVIDYLVHKVRNVDEKRSDGHTAVSLAIEKDQDEVVKILANNGANLEMKLKGNTLLMHAAENNAIKSINVLIMFGADPLEKNIRGKTALDLAKAKKKKQAYMLIAKIMKARLRESIENSDDSGE